MYMYYHEGIWLSTSVPNHFIGSESLQASPTHFHLIAFMGGKATLTYSLCQKNYIKCDIPVFSSPTTAHILNQPCKVGAQFP